MNRPIFNYSAHKALWLWLAENPAVTKSAWPGWDEYSSIPRLQCFACQYVTECRWYYRPTIYTPRLKCTLCPLDWGTYPQCSNNYNDAGLYVRYMRAASFERRSLFAKQIAELPVKQGVLYV